MKLRLATFFIIILVRLIPVEKVISQTADDGFAWQIAFTTAADTYLIGQNSSTALINFRDYIRSNYNNLIEEVKNGGGNYSDPNTGIAYLTLQRDKEVARFDQIINNAKASEEADPKVIVNLIHQVIMDGAAAVDLDSPPTLSALQSLATPTIFANFKYSKPPLMHYMHISPMA